MALKSISLIKLGSALPLIMALTVGCGNQVENNVDPNTSGGNESERVIVGSTSKPRTIDPADSYEVAGLNIIYNVTETLYTYEVGTTELKPLLATAMPTIS
jgi:peptide/nickel transport system substrate-binding protein